MPQGTGGRRYHQKNAVSGEQGRTVPAPAGEVVYSFAEVAQCEDARVCRWADMGQKVNPC